MIDTHCHLTFPDFAGKTDEVIAQASEAGVHGMITISTSSANVTDCLDLATTYDNVWCTSGIHPLYTDKDPREYKTLRRVIEHERCVAWGELGLDNHYDNPPTETQREVLAEQIALIESAIAGGIDKPVVIHSRKAARDILPFLKDSRIPSERFVFHCFTEPPEDARAVLDFGAMISITGVVTYKNAPEVAESAKLIPDDRIMVETDAPFLAPVPVRGTRPCVPAFTAHTAKFLAELRETPWPDFHRLLNDNTERFFGIRAQADAETAA